MKSILLDMITYGIASLLKLVPVSIRAKFIMKVINFSLRELHPKKGLQFLFELENRLYSLEGETSVRYGNGIHTKHKHINYHKFFTNNIKPGEHILDIGCGNGFMTYEMATRVPDVKIVGIEVNEANIKSARTHYRHPNLNFIHGDALKELPDETFDVVTLSNVLEHIQRRVDFLQKILRQIRPKRLIIRVPSFERDWRVPLKKELGVDYRLDATHHIEYTRETYLKELSEARLKPTHMESRWGEIWSVVEPLS